MSDCLQGKISKATTTTKTTSTTSTSECMSHNTHERGFRADVIIIRPKKFCPNASFYPEGWFILGHWLIIKHLENRDICSALQIAQIPFIHDLEHPYNCYYLALLDLHTLQLKRARWLLRRRCVQGYMKRNQEFRSSVNTLRTILNAIWIHELTRTLRPFPISEDTMRCQWEFAYADIDDLIFDVPRWRPSRCWWAISPPCDEGNRFHGGFVFLKDPV